MVPTAGSPQITTHPRSAGRMQRAEISVSVCLDCGTPIPARLIELARAEHPILDKMIAMREELRQLWLNTSMSREHLTTELAAWCHRAEASGIAALQEFSIMLRTAKA